MATAKIEKSMLKLALTASFSIHQFINTYFITLLFIHYHEFVIDLHMNGELPGAHARADELFIYKFNT